MLLKWYKESYKNASKMLVRMTFTCTTFHVCLYQNFRAKFNVCKWGHLFYSTLNDAFYQIEIKNLLETKVLTFCLNEDEARATKLLQPYLILYHNKLECLPRCAMFAGKTGAYLELQYYGRLLILHLDWGGSDWLQSSYGT